MKPTLFSAPRSRLVAAILGALATSIVITAAMPAYLPLEQGSAIAAPILLFPFTWVTLFLCCCMLKSIWHCWGSLVLLCVSHGWIIYSNLTGTL